ncbi:MAG: transcription termination factor Rho, partial [Solirubrobacteraceae bacterium]|nr:transcription termination factor Rho [Solirubrobacteraceae bacterium]
QGQAVDRTIDTARRIAARGGHAAVVIDALDHLPPGAARRALAAARNVPDGGSLTVIAAGREPAGGETTVIALDAEAATRERHPVLDPVGSYTLRTEALVGARKATTIAKNRIKKLEA